MVAVVYFVVHSVVSNEKSVCPTSVRKDGKNWQKPENAGVRDGANCCKVTCL